MSSRMHKKECDCPVCSLTDEQVKENLAKEYQLTLDGHDITTLLACLGLMVDQPEINDRQLKALSNIHAKLGSQTVPGIHSALESGDVVQSNDETNYTIVEMLSAVSEALVRKLIKHGLLDGEELAQMMGEAAGTLDAMDGNRDGFAVKTISHD